MANAEAQNSASKTPDSGLRKIAINDFLLAVRGLEKSLRNLPHNFGLGFSLDLKQALESGLPPLYKAYDGYLASQLVTEEKNVTCQKGCSHCCRHYVTSVEPFEILAIHLRIRQLEHYPDLLFAAHARTSKFEQILKKEGEDAEAEDRALYRYYLRGAPCPFLEKEGTCGIYEDRPMSCRMFFSESAPRFCQGKQVTSGWNKNFQVELPDEAEEALARCSELLAHLDLPVGLFAGVLEANALLGQYDQPSSD